jgi:hypothetical protein
VHVGDTRQPETISSLFEGVTHVICATGTTAFPSKRWDGGNGPEKTGHHNPFYFFSSYLLLLVLPLSE